MSVCTFVAAFFQRSLISALFPSACIGCSRAGSALCPSCVAGAVDVRRVPNGELVVYAAGRYAGTLRRAILSFKRGRRDVGDVLATVLAQRVLPRVARDAILVPVPTIAPRRRERGFDQGVRLARGCGEATERPVLVALSQVAGDGQRGRSRSARLRACHRFACTAPELVSELDVVLVDDVITTGATLRDCAATLAACGARVRGAIVLAYA